MAQPASSDSEEPLIGDAFSGVPTRESATISVRMESDSKRRHARVAQRFGSVCNGNLPGDPSKSLRFGANREAINLVRDAMKIPEPASTPLDAECTARRPPVLIWVPSGPALELIAYNNDGINL
jgi:hypothetical protein